MRTETLIFLIGLIAACFAQDAFVRIFHASPNTPPVDVYIDGTLVVTNLAYKAFTPNYLPLASGSHNIKVWPTGSTSGQGNPTINQDVVVTNSKFYTVFAVGLLTGTGNQAIQALMYEDQQGQATSTKIRAIQLSPNASPVNMVLQGNQSALLIGNITYQEATPIYLPLPGGFYALDFRPTNNLSIVAVSAPNATYANGTAYSVVLVGLAAGGNMSTLEIVTLIDGVTPGTTNPATTIQATSTAPATSNPATTIPSLTNGAIGSSVVLYAVLAAAFFLLVV